MIDLLIEKIGSCNNPTVIGLDPTLSMIPSYIKEESIEAYGKTTKALGHMFTIFNKQIINRIYDLVPAVKPQIAMYEQYGIEGLQAYMDTISYAKEKGLLVIGDIKRGDIGSTAASYAAHLSGVDIEGTLLDPWQEDAVTLNPYLGIDGIQPFIEAANHHNKGMFLLVKTSNPSSKDIQDLELKDSGKKVYEEVGSLVSQWGLQSMGKLGYSNVGAVVGATHREQGVSLRRQMPHTFFLVPGYGAQGGKAEDLKGFFDRDGIGCIVNSSRGITEAYKNSSKYGERDFAEAARGAVLSMKEDLNHSLSGIRGKGNGA